MTVRSTQPIKVFSKRNSDFFLSRHFQKKDTENFILELMVRCSRPKDNRVITPTTLTKRIAALTGWAIRPIQIALTSLEECRFLIKESKNQIQINPTISNKKIYIQNNLGYQAGAPKLGLESVEMIRRAEELFPIPRQKREKNKVKELENQIKELRKMIVEIKVILTPEQKQKVGHLKLVVDNAD